MTTDTPAPPNRRTPHGLLVLAWHGIGDAEQAPPGGAMFAAAHLAALRVASAIVVARTRPGRPRPSGSVWEMLTTVAPELGGWARMFARDHIRSAAAEAGIRGAVSDIESEDMVRAVRRFADLAETLLGLSARPATEADRG